MCCYLSSVQFKIVGWNGLGFRRFDADFVGRFDSAVNCRASDRCKREKRDTMTGDDLLWAMATLGFQLRARRRN